MALAFMFSCRTENMDESNLQKNLEKTSQAKFITKTVSLSGKDEIVQKSNIVHAFKNNKTNTAELDYKHVEYIETAGKKTYTFKILNSDAPGSFQNLVVIQYPDGTIKKKIITYSASENEKQSMLLGNMVNFSGKVISVTDLDDAAPNNTQGKYYESGGKCYSESIEVSPCGSGQHNSSNMDQWDKCTHPVKAKLIITVEEVPCGSGGSSSTGTGIGTDYGNDTQNPDNGGIDFPTAPTLTNLQFILFVNTLPQNLQDVVNNVDYLDFYTGLNNYFYYSNKTAAAKAFITWALQFKLANPDTTWEQFQNWFLEEPISGSLQNELFEDWADPTRVKPTTRFKKHIKINSIYNKIKTAANFKQYLQNFEPAFSVAHLMFDIGAVENPAALAQTKTPVNYWIKITFNKDWDFANTPKILIAGSFMHEIIHAEMYRKLLSLSSSNGNIDQALLGTMLNQHNYPGLFDYYIKNVKGNDSAQHQMMGAHYINIIKNALKQVYGNQYTDVEYLSIAWQGLKNTTAWSLLPQAERDLYEQTYQNNYNLWEK